MLMPHVYIYMRGEDQEGGGGGGGGGEEKRDESERRLSNTCTQYTCNAKGWG